MPFLNLTFIEPQKKSTLKSVFSIIRISNCNACLSHLLIFCIFPHCIELFTVQLQWRLNVHFKPI